MLSRVYNFSGIRVEQAAGNKSQIADIFLRNVIPVVRVEIIYVEGSQKHNSCMKKVYYN